MQLIQLRLQVIYFAFTLVQLFLQGTVQRLRQGDVSVHRYCQEVSCSCRVYYQVSVDQDKEAYYIVRDVSSLLGCRQSIPSISIASCAGVRNTLPSLAGGQPFGQQSQSIAGRPEELYLPAITPTEDKNVT